MKVTLRERVSVKGKMHKGSLIGSKLGSAVESESVEDYVNLLRIALSFNGLNST